MTDRVTDNMQPESNRSPVDNEAPPRVAQLAHRFHTPQGTGARGVDPGCNGRHAARGGHEGALVVEETHVAVPGRRSEAHDERAIVGGPQGTAEVAEVHPRRAWGCNKRRRGAGPYGEMPPVVDD